MRPLNGTHYVLPLRWTDDSGLAELTDYLLRLVRGVPVMVVDGSPPDLVAAHRAAWGPDVEVVQPDRWPGPNGKVAGVMTGVRRARADVVVIADDDVRWTPELLRAATSALGDADVLRPQNAFAPMPWHARWDTARTLVNRAFGSDYPGTLVIRRSSLLAAGGYRGDVMFENLELVRTLVALGGREVRADGLVVPRLPPSTANFWGQRVRQAYDDLAQPGRLVVEASPLPAITAALVARRPRGLLVLALALVLVAARGRQRHGGRRVFPRSAVLLAPVWALERAVCVWIAIVARLTGGVRYRGRRVRAAASSRRSLRRRVVL